MGRQFRQTSVKHFRFNFSILQRGSFSEIRLAGRNNEGELLIIKNHNFDELDLRQSADPGFKFEERYYKHWELSAAMPDGTPALFKLKRHQHCECEQ